MIEGSGRASIYVLLLRVIFSYGKEDENSKLFYWAIEMIFKLWGRADMSCPDPIEGLTRTTLERAFYDALANI